MRRLFLAGCLIPFVLLVVASVSQAAGTIKVGIVDSYVGPPAAYSQDVLDGFKMALTKINVNGVLGRKIEFVTRDDKFKPDFALSLAKELVMKEKVNVLMGTINSGAALAVSDYAKREKIPFIVTNAKTDKIVGEMGHRYVFNLSENSEMAARASAIELAKKPYMKYWIAGDDYEFGHAIADAFVAHIKALKPGVQIIGETWWKAGETDLNPYITQIMAAKPDFVYAATGGSSMVNFQKAARTTGMSDKIPFYQHAATEITIGQALGVDAPEGVYGTANYLFYYPDTPENKAFVAEFRKLYNRYPKMTAMYGYLAAQIIAKGYQKAGSVDNEKFINAVEGMVLDNTPVGKMEIRACDHQLTLPMFWGVTKKSPEYKEFLIATDIVTIPSKDYMPTCEQIAKLRSGK